MVSEISTFQDLPQFEKSLYLKPVMLDLTILQNFDLMDKNRCQIPIQRPEVR